MKKDGTVRKIFVKFRVSEKELELMKGFQKKSTERNLSNYIRKLTLQKPVILKYRDESADEILAALLKMKNELNAIGNNFNQAVHKLHTLGKIPEFRSWIISHEITRQNVENKIDDIKERMNQLYQKWLQK